MLGKLVCRSGVDALDGFVTKYTFLVAVGPDTRSCIKVGPVLSFFPFPHFSTLEKTDIDGDSYQPSKRESELASSVQEPRPSPSQELRPRAV